MSGRKHRIKYFIFTCHNFKSVLRTLFILFALTTTLSASGHEYFFAYAEVEYNDFSKNFEATVVATAHDFEEAISKEGMGNKLDELDSSGSDLQMIEDYLNTHFVLEGTNVACSFKLVGMEVLLNGMVNFYLQSNEVTLSTQLNARFDLLMNDFSEQQNKLTLLYQGNSKTISFLQHKKEQEIELSKL